MNRQVIPGSAYRAVLRRALLFMAATLLALAAVSCPSPTGGAGSGSPSDVPQGDPAAPTQPLPFSLEAGPGGGSANFEDVAVSVPAGALPTALRITGTYYPLTSGMADGYGVVPFLSGITFGPAGTRFAKPVTVRMRPEIETASGEIRPIYLYDPDKKAWREQEARGTVDADGLVEFRIDHFSTFAPGALGNGGLATYPNTLEATGDPDAAYAALQDAVLQGGELFALKRKMGEDTYGVCGAYFDVMSKHGETEKQFVDLLGEKTGLYTNLYYSIDKQTTDGVDLLAHVQVMIYWKKIPLVNYKIDFTLDIPSSSWEDIVLSGYHLDVEAVLAIDENEEKPKVAGIDPNFPVIISQKATARGGKLKCLDPEYWLENIRIPTSIRTDMIGTIVRPKDSAYYVFTPMIPAWGDETFVEYDIYGENDDGPVRIMNCDHFLFAPPESSWVVSPAGSNYGSGFLVELYDGSSSTVTGSVQWADGFEGECSITVTRLP